jgi:hypothetical protein
MAISLVICHLDGRYSATALLERLFLEQRRCAQ